jgi:ABC-type multidrug transport system fused ATPase/permease subunit
MSHQYPVVAIVLCKIAHHHSQLHSMARTWRDVQVFEIHTPRALLLHMPGRLPAPGAERHGRRRGPETSERSSALLRRALLLRVNAVQLAINVVTAAGTTGVLYLAARAALAGELSVGAILAVSMYLQNLVRPTIGLSRRNLDRARCCVKWNARRRGQ